MAKRRLNKKLVLIGSAVFTILAVLLILAILYRSRDPEKYIKDGDAAAKAALEATDKETKIQEYTRAERNYHRARSRTKDDALKIETLFKLVDLYIQMNDYTEDDRWRHAAGCWSEIIRTDSKNMKARYGQLKYYYIMADGGVHQIWPDVRDQAVEFIEIAKDENLLTTNPAKWETAGMPEVQISELQLGPYLYLIAGRANLELARRGLVPDPDELIAQAVDDLEKALEFDPYNIDAYWYLAQASLLKGQNFANRGNLEERDGTVEHAKELLRQAIKAAPDNPKGYIGLLTIKVATTQSEEQIQAFEPEYLSLVDKFPSSAEAFSAISQFYSDPRMDPKNLDKATKAAEEAVRLDKENVIYALKAANLHYSKFYRYRQKDELYKAIELVKNALTLPTAQEQKGPRYWTNRINRASLYILLANCYIEQILEPCEEITDSQTAVLLANAEQVIHEIEQIFGSGEEPQVIKWRGMLELAKGNKDVAIKKLYGAYEQLKASARSDAQLSYTLARIFKNTPEVGAVAEFLISALKTDITMVKPEAKLDYIDVLLKLRAWTIAISNITVFEETFGPDKRSQILRVKAYIGAKQFDEAEEELASLKLDDPNMIKLKLALVQGRIEQLQRAIGQKRIQQSQSLIPQSDEPETSEQLMTEELNSYRQSETELVRKLLPIEPNSVGQTSITSLCKHYIAQSQINEAKDLVNQFLQYSPDDTSVLFYKQILSEPEPGNVPKERLHEIEEQVLSNVDDPIKRAIRLGAFYRRNNEQGKAVAEFKKVLKMQPPQQSTHKVSVFEREPETLLRPFAADQLLDILLEMKDWEQAKQVVETAQRENLDKCQGLVFASRLDAAQGNFKDALAKLNEALKQRPIFARAYMLRGNINANLANEHAYLEDIRRAASLNPLDSTIAKALAIALYTRDLKSGEHVSSEQALETKTAMDVALSLNTNDLELLNFYAGYISQTDPFRALAIRQSLQKNVPSLQNAILLGQLATEIAIKERDSRRKNALFDIAASSFEQAKAIDPHDRAMLFSYAKYFQAIGDSSRAQELLQESQDKELLGTHYFQEGQFEKARKTLEQMYEDNPKDPSVLKSLLFLSAQTSDGETAKKYSEELLSVQDNAENRLLQIQTFIQIGLIKESEQKLQSFKEKYPDEPRAMLLEAWIAMRQGQLERALESTNQILARESDNAVAWRLRGEINLLTANYTQAISDLTRSKQLSGEADDTKISLAKAYLKMGREDDAITELRNMIDSPGASMESRLLLEQIYLKLGRKEALKRFYDDTLEKFPDDALWYNRAGAFAINNGNFDKAEQLYKKAYTLKTQEYSEAELENKVPEDAQFAIALDGYLRSLVAAAGSSDAKNGNWNPTKLDQVFAEAGKYVDTAFSPLAYLRMAEAKLKLGDKRTAVEYCRKAVDNANTNELLASDILLKMFLLLGPEEVSNYCKQKIETNPDSLAANWTMYNLSKINAKYNEAVNYLDKCIKIIGPGTPEGLNYTVNKAEILTIAYQKSSDNNYLTQAIAVYESLLVKMPNNINVLNNLAYMLAQNNERLSDALQYAKKAVEANPNEANLLDTYGYVLYKNGKFSQANEFLVAALQQYEQNEVLAPAAVYEHIGMVKEELGAKNQALAAYQQALEIGADKLSTETEKRIKSAIERLSR